jgi:hypothetical protein
MQRGRKSFSANVVALRPVPRAHLTPPSNLTSAERAIFTETAAQYPHLKPGDAMILAAFAQASVRSFALSKKNDTAAWERAVRAMLAIARSLRLTPQSHTRAEALGRKRDQATSTTSYYDRMREDADD